MRSSTEKYQVLQATLVDTWASTAAGAFALSENNLYTSDAFYDYLSHLTDDGVLAFTRWGFEPPRESLRLVSLAMDALARLGEPNSAAHVIAVRDDATKINGWGAQDTVLISRKPFSAADLENARRLAAESHMDVVYLPGAALPHNAFGQLLSSANPKQFWNAYQYDVSPVGDDRPFFFYTVQPRDLWNFVRNANQESADYKINRAVPLLFGLMGLSIVVTGLILVLPRLVLGSRLPKQKNVMTFLWYFLCLGAGYILVQVALIQKFVLLLGHPTYALTVIVFSMLVASGVGSYLSSRVIAGDDVRLVRVLAAVAVLVGILAFVSTPLVTAAAGWPLAAKMHSDDAGRRSRGVPDGHAVPERSAATGAAPRAVGALGLVAQCGRERARLGQRDLSGDLHRPALDAAGRRGAVSLCAGGDSGDAPARRRQTGMNSRRVTARILTLAAALIACSCGPASPQGVPAEYGYEVVHTYPHDTSAFTEGLFYLDGFLYESTGLERESSIRKVRLETGEVVQRYDLPPQYFGEGIINWKDRLIQLTYQTHVGFVYDLAGFRLERQFEYPGEGWALTQDGKRILMSDGTPEIRFWDPETLQRDRPDHRYQTGPAVEKRERARMGQWRDLRERLADGSHGSYRPVKRRGRGSCRPEWIAQPSGLQGRRNRRVEWNCLRREGRPVVRHGQALA